MQEEAAAVFWETIPPGGDWERYCKPDCERAEELWRRRKAQSGQSLATDRAATKDRASPGFQQLVGT